MAGFASLGFEADFRALERGLDDVAKKALPKAAAGYLNGLAFAARDQLVKHGHTAFDRPVKFTDRAWVVDKAKPGERGAMVATVKALPAQSAYLQYQIFGGQREAGDPGAGEWDVFAYSDRVTKAGGVDKGYLKRLSKRNRDEKNARAKVRATRVAVRAKREAGEFGPFGQTSWVVISKNRPGIFFGEIGGVEGYWERPRRTKAAAVRKKGRVTVTPRGNNRPKLLFQMKDSVSYKPRFNYDGQIGIAMHLKGGPLAFRKELDRAVGKSAR